MDNQVTTGDARPRRRRRWLWYLGISTVLLVTWQVAAWLTPVPAPLASAAAVTDRVYEAVYSEDIIKRAEALPKEVNILLVGLDNRLASTDNHADAIHVISIRTKDSVGATVISIPRGTEAKGYGIDDEFAFMANVRALKGRKTFIKAVSKLTRKKINYYVEVTFSQVMGVLELIGYKDPATALQFLRHRKTYALGDIQRSYVQGKFIKQQMIRRGDLLTGAKGDILMRMGLGMVDTDLDLETAQALVYLLKEKEALKDERITQTMMPRTNLARLDGVEIPEPEEVAATVNKLVRKTGDDIDDLGRYNPYPGLRSIVTRAQGQQKNPRAVVATLEQLYTQKAWLQIQERPQRREIRGEVEELLVRAYTELKKPEKAAEVRKYMEEERQAFHEVEREARRFSYGKRNVPNKKNEKPDPVAAARARQDDIRQKQTRIEPQPPTISPVELKSTSAAEKPATEHPAAEPQQSAPKESPKEAPKAERPAEEPQVLDIKPKGGTEK